MNSKKYYGGHQNNHNLGLHGNNSHKNKYFKNAK